MTNGDQLKSTKGLIEIATAKCQEAIAEYLSGSFFPLCLCGFYSFFGKNQRESEEEREVELNAR